MKKYLILASVLLSVALAVIPAKLNVITDLGSGAVIEVDGVKAGTNAIQNYAVDPGSHYVTVKLNGKKIYAQTHNFYDGEVKTISTAHFVDFKTNVANRGAIDVEAARIRETRGDFGIGAYASTSFGGLSIKKWLSQTWGLQLFGLINNHSGGTEYQGGGRVLMWIADKVAFDAPFTGYVFVGGGYSNFVHASMADDNVHSNSTNGGFGVEFSLLGVNGLFTSLELGVENRYYDYSDSSQKAVMKGQTFGGGGIHFYF